ncbi:MAG: hypothetical protein M3Y54_15030 [Bacteroidota bacterium]|nr:hypothetical protein [Bacteroidota bacterium]
MNTQDTALLQSGQRVGLAVADFTKELADFAPLQAAEATRAELVAAIEDRQSTQDTDTTATTTDKETARERMAQAAALLSTRAQGYALSMGDVGLKQALTLGYTDVRYGEATEDVNHVRELVRRVQALPKKVRDAFRLTDAVVQAPADAADAFEAADDTQTTAKAAPRLATLALPELLRRLGAALRLMQTLIAGQRTDTDPQFRWAALDAAFAQANKRQAVAASARRSSNSPRIVRRLPITVPDGRAVRLAVVGYGPAYTLTVENRAATPLHLWLAQKDGAPTTPQPCPAGQTTVLTRRDLGPETARYLMAQFDGTAGGNAALVVRRVV